ncbi:cytochrome [Bacillus sp. FJAT-27225]|uniref:cytochrome P450 n=1 Tax=Bacillus sp. FJAT-27225 TaxID=1743144 RepID=UPI00080C30FE|nr:cytochrome P450 [Bacillus sp. FJAT-27225]OCA85698.1 cytochrome [Bacillus sp. FJAT-27225]
MSEVPKDKSLDNSLALMQEGYTFIQNRTKQYGADLFEARILGQKAVCMTGEEAVKRFYDNEFFQRTGAAPKRIQKTLFGVNAIQTKDGAVHQSRKSLFMALLSPEGVKELGQLAYKQFQKAARKWEGMEQVILFDESAEVLCRIACEWAGVPLKEDEARQRANDFNAMVDAFGAVGPRHWKGRRARERGEAWIIEVIEKTRSGELQARQGSALQEWATYRDPDGEPLDAKMAAIELINILRPIVAISTFISYCALAIHDYPECREKLKSEGNQYREWFVQEVRRFYPFGPFLGARARKDFTWNGYNFTEGQLVLLDIFGTNHDYRLWEFPNEFHPERFREWDGNPYSFIPQGGGDPARGHRCPGEGVTVEVMKVAVDFLVNHLQYDVPDGQDLSYSLIRMPSRPASGFIMANVKRRNEE